MLHCERLSVQVSRKQSLRMLRCQQVNRNEIWIRIPVCVEIDGRFDVGPSCLGYRRIRNEACKVHQSVQHEYLRVEPVKTQSEGEHEGSKADVVVDPVRWVCVVVQPGYVSTNPDSRVSEVVEGT